MHTPWQMAADHWLIAIPLLILLTFLLSYTEQKTFQWFTTRHAHKSHLLRKILWLAIHPPLYAGIWLVGIFQAACILIAKWPAFVLFPSFGSVVQKLSIFIFLVWAFMRFVRLFRPYFIDRIRQKDHSKMDPTVAHALFQLLWVSIFIIFGLGTLDILGIPVSAVLTFGGIGGIAVGFAAKDLLANIFGGLVIFMDRPFKIGDWIASPDKRIEGTVEDIGWRRTKIRTFDKRPLYVPNNVFLNVVIENPSEMTNRRIKTVIGVRYQDAKKISQLLEAVEDMLRHHPDIDKKQTLFVKLISFGTYSLNFLVYTFTKTTHWVAFQSIQQDVFLKILGIIEQHGAECAFPTSNILINKMDSDKSGPV